MIESWLLDLRYAARVFVRTPVLTGAAVLTLSLGIGATSGIFSVVDSVLLQPLPYQAPERRVMIWSRWKGFDKTWVSEAEVFDYRERCRSLKDVAAWAPQQGNLVGDGEPERVGFARVTANVFSVLGTELLHGRTFTEAEDLPGGPPVAVLGHTLWQKRYGGDPGVLDRTVQLDGVSYAVVGILPEGFQLPTDFNVSATEPTLLYLPLAIDPDDLSRGSHGLYAAAELAPGASAGEATADLGAVTANLTRDGLYHEAMQFTALAVPVEEEILGSVRPAVLLLSGAVSFLLLIACANVANLLLAAAERREREMAMRAALGAGRGRLVKQVLTEGLALAAIAGALGLLLAYGAIRLASSAHPSVIPRASTVDMDLRVVAFTAGLALATTLLFSLAPALHASRSRRADSLRAGGTRVSVGQKSLRSTLVVAEMALAVVLVIGAGLMIRSLSALREVKLGFEPANVLTLRLSLPQTSYDQPAEVVRFYAELLDRVRGLPGVEQAGVLRSLPLAAPIGDWGLDVEGFVETPGNEAKGDWQVASDGASEALGERLVAGRTFSASDTTDSQLVALVNETMARRYWDDGNPVGKRIRMGGRGETPWITVVGVLGDVRHNGITEAVKEKFVVPHSQFHLSTRFAVSTMTLVVESKESPLALVAPIRAHVRELDANLPVSSVRLLEDVVKDSIATTRVTSLVLSIFGALALGLAAIGIYAVLSYLVGRRTQEIGIRMAMGAPAREVVGLAVGKGLFLSALGIGVGVLASIGLTRLMASLLTDVQPTDPATFVLVPAILGVVALLSSYFPARRAMRVDPVVALKAE